MIRENKKMIALGAGLWMLLLVFVLPGGCMAVTAAEASESSAADSSKQAAGEPALSKTKMKVTSSVKKELLLTNCAQTPVWASSNKKVAAVKKTSDPCRILVKGRKAGKAVITAKVGKKTYQCKVTVKYKPRLSLSKKTLKGNNTVTLTVTGTTSKPKWSCSDPEIISYIRVSARKVTVKGVRNGKAWIYARVNGKTLKCRIKVKGRQQPSTNCILGSASTGYYYVDPSGTRVYDAQITAAINYLHSASSSGDTPRQRMLACFKKMCTYTYRWHPDSPCAAVMPTYAADTFRTKIGNCWRFGAAFAYIARVLGYESRVCIGGVTAYQNHALDNHGWCEVLIDGSWKMVDVSMQMHHPEVNLFLVPRSSYPFRLRCDSVYTMHVSGGGISWS